MFTATASKLYPCSLLWSHCVLVLSLVTPIIGALNFLSLSSAYITYSFALENEQMFWPPPRFPPIPGELFKSLLLIWFPTVYFTVFSDDFSSLIVMSASLPHPAPLPSGSCIPSSCLFISPCSFSSAFWLSASVSERPHILRSYWRYKNIS